MICYVFFVSKSHSATLFYPNVCATSLRSFPFFYLYILQIFDLSEVMSSNDATAKNTSLMTTILQGLFSNVRKHHDLSEVGYLQGVCHMFTATSERSNNFIMHNVNVFPTTQIGCQPNILFNCMCDLAEVVSFFIPLYSIDI